MSYFDITNRLFSNAGKFKVNVHRLTRYDPVDELIRQTGMCFNDLGSEEDDYVINLRRGIWKLRSSVVFSLMPFNSKGLRLLDQMSDLLKVIEYVPYLLERIDKISEIVNFLLENPMNPKRDTVLSILNDTYFGPYKIGLVTNLARGPVPGWTEETYQDIKQNAPNVKLISSPKIFKSSILNKLVLPAGGNLCPYIYSLYFSYRSRSLDIVVYDREYIKSPKKRYLPQKSCFPSRTNVVTFTDRDRRGDITEAISKEEENAQRIFWDYIRSSVLKDNYDKTDHSNEFLIESRLILLENNKKVYLRDDLYVIEISDYIDGVINIEEQGKRFPRRQVKRLEYGDLIVLRTSGSGDYLYEVADNLMRADSRRELREKALDWKALLKKALETKGSEYFFNKLKNKGHKLSVHQYIWTWSTVFVIRPHSKELFTDLIMILYNLGYYPSKINPAKLAEKRWNQMKDIIRYHITAGHRIRKSLLSKLRSLIKRGITITDHYNLTLSEEGAGKMSVFRVAGTDTKTIQIPYTKVGVIMKLDD